MGCEIFCFDELETQWRKSDQSCVLRRRRDVSTRRVILEKTSRHTKVNDEKLTIKAITLR